MEFIPACMGDAALLLKWRNDPVTRSMSLATEMIEWETHIDWLKGKISCDGSNIYIAHRDSVSIGSIRSEQDEGYNKISWVLAPEHRGRGLGKQMLREFVQLYENKYTAIIRIENIASQKICTFAGFKEFTNEIGLIYYKNY